MKKYLTLNNTLFFIVLTLALTIVSGFMFFFMLLAIEIIFYNGGSHAKYYWNVIFSLLVTLIAILMIHRSGVKWHKSKNETDGIPIWNISSSVITSTLVLFLGFFLVGGIKEFINRDKDNKITSLGELLDKSGELAGSTIQLSDPILDSTLFKEDVIATIDNKNLKWKKVVSGKGSFSIRFPNFETNKKTTIELINEEELPVYSISVNTEKHIDSNLVYTVSYFQTQQLHQVGVLFEQQTENVLSKFNGTLESESIIDTLGYPCRELHISLGKNHVKAAIRMIYRYQNFYQIMVLTEQEKLPNKAIGYFINSFEFL